MATEWLYECPHCGEKFKEVRPDGCIFTHDFPRPCRAVCPGSGHHSRRDDQPLWMDATDSSDLAHNLRILRNWCVGERLDEVQAEASKAGYICRVVRQDGAVMVGTADFNLDRFNVRVENGLVTEVVSIG